MAQLLREEGCLAGFFFTRETERGPPFGISAEGLRALLDPFFERLEDRPATGSLPVFEGAERWQVWRKR
jgi:thiopurine S-methyltransferase